MKLFINYSRDDKTWVYEFWRALQDSTNYEIWLDRRLVPASDWWDTILEHVENCDCFISILSPQAAESIYCQAELDYALALNKPILPLILKTCAYPAKLNNKRIQYENITNMPVDRVLIRATLALGEIQLDIMKGLYPKHTLPRPSLPTPHVQRPDHIFEVFAMAEEAASQGNDTLAHELFHQVALTDPAGLGLAATQRIVEVRFEREREIAYNQILRLANDPATRRGAQVAWQVYLNKYGAEHDPERLMASLQASSIPAILYQAPFPQTPAKFRPPSSPRAVLKQPRSADILPSPFEWVEIPQGLVRLEMGGYVPDEGLEAAVTPFAIAKYPITVDQYSLFIEAGGYDVETYWTQAGWYWRQSKFIDHPRFWQEPQWHQPTLPIVGVSWYESMAYCHWLSDVTSEMIVLPTESQWQRAAQGDDGRLYPWGDTLDETCCNPSHATGQTTPVTQYPNGASPYGVMDMCGNVWEWCLTDGYNGRNDIEGGGSRVLRGGTWDSRQDVAQTTMRLNYFPSFRFDLVGFRIARLTVH